ncbi:MAG: phosphomannomutase/phosphoglucomutase [Chloroflexi bacterium]|nr:phosphomannomutase/phosphoglucomutase [Chloroflexota bacterium]
MAATAGKASVPAEIFREYDIRGLVDKELTDDVYYQLGRAYGTFLYAQEGVKPVKGERMRVASGRDVRLSSDRFQEALTRGMLDSGVDVIDVGEVPTPVLYFSVKFLDTDGGAEVTASHNPADYNGLKLRKRTGDGLNAPLTSDNVQELRRIIERGEFHDGKGEYKDYPTQPEYVKYITDTVKVERPLKVVIDPGNGVTGPTAMQIYKALGCDVSGIYLEPDGNFPHHLPNPLKEENVVDLIAEVKKQGADVGIGIDGDGDRLGVIDNDGNIVWPDMYMILYARKALQKEPGGCIIFDVKCSLALPEDIEKHGGAPIMWRTGYTNVFAKRLETGAPFAGEFSGHMFFNDPLIDFDDGIYAGARLLEAIGDSDSPISARFDDVPKYFNTPEGRIDVDESKKFGIIDRLKAKFEKEYKVITLDGARVVFPTGWALVRASNTEPAITYRFESTRSQEDLDRIKVIMRDALAAEGVKADF